MTNPSLSCAARVAIAPGFGDAANCNYGHAIDLIEYRGALYMVQFYGPGHAAVDGKIAIRKSVNGGRTWSLPVVLFAPDNSQIPNPNNYKTLTGPEFAIYRDGVLRFSYWETNERAVVPAIPSRWIWMTELSGTDPMTPSHWAAPWPLPQFGTNRTTRGSWGPQLADGTVTCAIYTQNNGSPSYQSRLIQSPPDCKNWTLRSMIMDDGIVPYEEPQLGNSPLPDGRWMCLVREDRSNTGGRIWRTYSSDQGLSWGPKVEVFKGWDWPRWRRLEDGLMVCATRAEAAILRSVPVLFTSADFGETWQGPIMMGDPSLGTTGRQMFAGMVELGPGVLACVHGEEPLGLGTWGPATPPAVGEKYTSTETPINGITPPPHVDEYTRSRIEFSLWKRDGIELNTSPSNIDSVLEACSIRMDSPKPLGDIVAWHDPQAAAARSKKLKRVGQDAPAIIRDSSGNKNHLHNSSPLSFVLRYTIGATSWQNSKAFMQTDGVAGKVLQTDLFPVPIPQPFVLFLAFCSNAAVVDVHFFDDGAPVQLISVRRGAGSKMSIRAGLTSQPSPTPTLFTPGPVDISVPALYRCVFNGPNSSIWRNGVQLAAGPIGTAPLTRMRFGGPSTGQMDLREDLLLRGNAPAEIAQIEDALMKRSGLLVA